MNGDSSEENRILENAEINTLPEIKDDKSFIDVGMNTFGITSAKRRNTILRTVGLGSCTGVTIRDPESTITGLLHLTEPSPFADSYWMGVNADIWLCI